MVYLWLFSWRIGGHRSECYTWPHRVMHFHMILHLKRTTLMCAKWITLISDPPIQSGSINNWSSLMEHNCISVSRDFLAIECHFVLMKRIQMWLYLVMTTGSMMLITGALKSNPNVTKKYVQTLLAKSKCTLGWGIHWRLVNDTRTVNRMSLRISNQDNWLRKYKNDRIRIWNCPSESQF